MSVSSVCRFWQPGDHYTELGECRRHAPQPFNGREGSAVLIRFPLTMPDDWCGDCAPGEFV
jgi:hypothetical protein